MSVCPSYPNRGQKTPPLAAHVASTGLSGRGSRDHGVSGVREMAPDRPDGEAGAGLESPQLLLGQPAPRRALSLWEGPELRVSVLKLYVFLLGQRGLGVWVQEQAVVFWVARGRGLETENPLSPFDKWGLIINASGEASRPT